MEAKRFLETGRIVATHGINGQVRVQPWSDAPGLLTEFDSFFLDSSGKSRIEIESSFVHKNIVVIKIAGIDTIEQAQQLKNKTIYIDREDIDLPEGAYFIQDLIGLEVRDFDTGRIYGKLTHISQPGANDVYHVIDNEKSEYLIPAIPEVIIDIDLNSGIIKIRPLKGLFDI